MISTAQTFPRICADLEAQDRPAHSSMAVLDVDTPADSATWDLSSPPTIWHTAFAMMNTRPLLSHGCFVTI